MLVVLLVVTAFVALALTLALVFGRRKSSTATQPQQPTTSKKYTAAEVAKHAGPDSVWVSYNGGVYDISDFVMEHPGGYTNIMKAAGGPLETWWSKDPYTFHPTNDRAQAFLKPRRIGDLANPPSRT